MKISLVILFSLSAVFASSAAFAVDIYKYVLPNGSVLYSQTAIKHRKPAKVVRVEPLTPAQRKEQQAAQKQLQQLQVKADQLALELTAQQLAENAARPDVAPPLPDQRVAELLVPLPGERIANAHGFSRLTDAYWQRLRMELGPDYPAMLQSSAIPP
jgi:hypothetical protein